MQRNAIWLLAVLSGMLMVLSSAPFDQWYLSYIAYVPLFLATRNVGLVKRGAAFALACSAIAVNWWHSTIIYSFAFFALIVSILCVSFFLWGVLSGRYSGKGSSMMARVFIPAIIWIGLERILSSEVVGIPCNIGISQWDIPVLIQSASFFGIYTTSFLIVLVNTTIALLLERKFDSTSFTKRQWVPVVVSLALITGNLVYGMVKTSGEEGAGSVKVSIIQPVIASDMYRNGWRNPESRLFVKKTLDDLTRQALDSDPDILVWPEGGNGYMNMRIPELRDKLYEIAASNNVDLLISSNDMDQEGRKYNAIFSISREGRLLGRYNKVNLIPGAEDGYTAGPGFHTIPSTFGPIGPSICYESNFPSPLRKVSAKGAELLVVSTSDAAFKKTSLTINHTRTAVFRAIENNRWVVHASNTGPSAIVSPRGYVLAESGFYERGVLRGAVEFVTAHSVFTRYGHYLPVLLSIVVLVQLTNLLFSLARTRRPLRGSGAGVQDREEQVRKFLSRALRVYFPVAMIYVGLLSGVVISSLLVSYSRAVTAGPIHYALREFLEPLDTLVEDKVTDKFLQAKSNTCGPAVMAYMFSYLGKEVREQDLVKQVSITEKGTSMLELKNLSIRNGFHATGVKESYSALMQEPLPVVAYINNNHYVVVNRISRTSIYLFDPAIGHVVLPRSLFEQVWNGYLLLVRMQPINESLAALPDAGEEVGSR